MKALKIGNKNDVSSAYVYDEKKKIMADEKMDK